MISGIIGDIGAGKTMLETCFLTLGADSGHKIYANYKLKAIPYTHLGNQADFLAITGDKNLIGLDEYWLSADSRRSSSVLNLATTTWGLQSRKIHSDVIITTQGHMQLDIRLRQLIRLWMEPSIALTDKDGKPTMLKVSARILKGSSTIDRTFYMPTVLNTKRFGVVDIPNSYDSYEIISEIDLNPKDQYKKLIKKYEGYDSGEKGLAAILEFDENLQKSEAKDLAAYIKAKGC